MNIKGFTIVELLAVIAIVGDLVPLAAPSKLGQSKKLGSLQWKTIALVLER